MAGDGLRVTQMITATTTTTTASAATETHRAPGRERLPDRTVSRYQGGRSQRSGSRPEARWTRSCSAMKHLRAERTHHARCSYAPRVSSLALHLHALDYAWLVPGYIVMGIGIGMTVSPTTTDAMGVAAPAQRSQASGIARNGSTRIRLHPTARIGLRPHARSRVVGSRRLRMRLRLGWSSRVENAITRLQVLARLPVVAYPA